MRVHTQLRAISQSDLESLLRRLMITEIKMKESGVEPPEEKEPGDTWIWKKEE